MTVLDIQYARSTNNNNRNKIDMFKLTTDSENNRRIVKNPLSTRQVNIDDIKKKIVYISHLYFVGNYMQMYDISRY